MEEREAGPRQLESLKNEIQKILSKRILMAKLNTEKKISADATSEEETRSAEASREMDQERRQKDEDFAYMFASMDAFMYKTQDPSAFARSAASRQDEENQVGDGTSQNDSELEDDDSFYGKKAKKFARAPSLFDRNDDDDSTQPSSLDEFGPASLVIALREKTGFTVVQLVLAMAASVVISTVIAVLIFHVLQR